MNDENFGVEELVALPGPDGAYHFYPKTPQNSPPPALSVEEARTHLRKMVFHHEFPMPFEDVVDALVTAIESRSAEALRAATERAERLEEHHKEYVEGKMWAYGVDAMYDHDCSLGDACPVVAVADVIDPDRRALPATEERA